jgi:hypothetical protein
MDAPLKSSDSFDLIVLGGGAAGFFGALAACGHNPALRVMILEKSPRLLAKVRISGGGRCNVTHDETDPSRFASHYPRGQKAMRQLLRKFSAADTRAWFERLGVKLKTEPDGRMFPVTNDSMTIVNCLLHRAQQAGIEIGTSVEVVSVTRQVTGFILSTSTGGALSCRNLLVATGGSPKNDSYDWLRALGVAIVPPVPSLFTLNCPGSPLKDLMGISVGSAELKLAGTVLRQSGPLLITHWGLSGPAALRLSAWGARHLKEMNYAATVLINWTTLPDEDSVRQVIGARASEVPGRGIENNPLFHLPARLWKRLCGLAGISPDTIWGELARKDKNRLVENLYHFSIAMKGKTTFKEEFVTCGGVDLPGVNLTTMEHKKITGLYFAGEVLDIDGETGGFNFQAAWTTGWVAGRAIAESRR